MSLSSNAPPEPKTAAPDVHGVDLPAPPKSRPFLSEFSANVLSAVSSVTIGSISAWSVIDRNAYKNLSSLHVFESIKEKRRVDGPDILQKALSGTYTPKKALSEVSSLIAKNHDQSDNVLAKLGIKNMFDKWRVLRDHQQSEAIVTFLATAGISLGTMYLMTHSALSKKEQDAVSAKAEGQPETPATPAR